MEPTRIRDSLTIKPFALKLRRSSNTISVFSIKAKIRLNGRIGKTAFPIHEPDLDKVLIKKAAQKARMMQPGNTIILERSNINPLFMELWKRATLKNLKR